ncbi:S-layer homology domain-containing protein [Cohnella sp. GCM10027633]|uniref:S-layer homology domain-containing protein n=1 Tax=unclassified Cohnella TaxID=2636738 RepID=UPI00362C0DC4
MGRLARRVGLLLVCGIAALALTGFAAPQRAYEEASRSWAAATLKEWLDRGWLQGYADGTIQADEPVTRAELATLINRAFGLTEKAEALSYPDVRTEKWEYDEVAKGVRAGYAAGYADGEFKPGQAASRQEAAQWLANVLGLDPSRDDLFGFADAADVDDASRGAVAVLAAYGIVRGFPDGTFRPASPLSRASAIVMVDAARRADADYLLRELAH